MHRSNIKRISNTGHQCTAPWCGGGRGLGAPASPHAKRNPTDHDSRDVRALVRRAAAAHPARGRRCGHRGRRHHRRDHGPHPGGGGACSRSAVGRYVKNVRGLIRQQQETDQGIEMWVRALGARAQGRAGLILIETLRTLTLSAMADLSRREEPVSTEELARLALVLRRIEGTDKLRLEREQAAAKAARAAPGAGQAPVRKGLSPEAVAAIREVVEGRPRRPARAVTSAPVDPWNPAESHSSQLIPLNPGESRSENVSGVSRPGPNTHLTPSPEAEGETQTATACSPSPPRRRGEGRGEVGGELCRLRPPRHRAADPARPEPLAARALPRPHPGLQGFRAADGGPPPGRGVM